ncbi:MAG TPA: 3-hydroxyacyl-CoA dehydrogenase NAD-binding domain-containing protein, partial [Saprospiraceae bacterium]|nr:3-hydroxyacyl-CoA dehydrogenase NAD-binding domain-containing protein [Saprospiraceae bacterium]
MKKITVIGAGAMGNGIAHVFAMHGYQVALVDIAQAALDKGMATIEKNLSRMQAKEKITEAEMKATLGRIHTFTSLAEGVKEAELVVEAATENIGLKLKIFEEL